MGEGPRRQVPRFNRTPQSLPLLVESKEPQRMPSLDLDGGSWPSPNLPHACWSQDGGLATLESWASWFLVGLAPFRWEWKKPNKGPHYPLAIHAEKAMPQSMTGTGTGHWTFDKRQGQASKSSRHAATRDQITALAARHPLTSPFSLHPIHGSILISLS